MNFLQTGRISLDSVALNIMTCLECGVLLKMVCTSPRMSARTTPGSAGGRSGKPDCRVHHAVCCGKVEEEGASSRIGCPSRRHLSCPGPCRTRR